MALLVEEMERWGGVVACSHLEGFVLHGNLSGQSLLLGRQIESALDPPLPRISTGFKILLEEE
jgi:hypothetical protein